MTEAIVIALITGGLAILSNIVVTWANNSKTLYRIEILEKKVEAHNNLVERMTIDEQNTKAQWRQIDEIKERLNSLPYMKE